SWNADKLSERLITAISEDKFIKRALFPPPGPNGSTSKGGGMKKVVAQWKLCLLLFGDDPRYKEAVAAATTNPTQQTVWANKVKNRLRNMATTTRDYIAEMGQTGAGMACTADIDMSRTNAFTTKWR
ncbi:hypothetical protein C8R45DRAFT_781754, partial [Mycena sanguinolenta]